jgi:predicted AAA+ superfamily ATPase
MIWEVVELSRHFLQKYNRPYVRYFTKHHPLASRFSIVLGGRGVGKSTAMIQHLASYASGDILSLDILYVQSDHFLVSKYSLYEIAEGFCKRGGKLICFDEIHKYANWSQELKSISDTFTPISLPTLSD